MITLGIDTSNYTTSAALYDSTDGSVYEKRRLLKVKPGELGLRQSDAVFQHTVALPEILRELFEQHPCIPDNIAVSTAPRDEDGSYMPCFMSGKCVAESLGAVFARPVSYFSHQAGHITAALYSAGRLELIGSEFIAFHVSGGTTEAVKVSSGTERPFCVEQVASSLDLKAGQAIDRVGVMLGSPFPAGPELDRLSLLSEKKYKIAPFMRGGNCSFSGIQNKCEKMHSQGESAQDIARFCIEYIYEALRRMTSELTVKYPGLPLIYSGGVMSNTIIRERFAKEFGAVFAAPGYSSDNAVGIAVLGSMKA